MPFCKRLASNSSGRAGGGWTARAGRGKGSVWTERRLAARLAEMK
jgi:hypothetical protein